MTAGFLLRVHFVSLSIFLSVFLNGIAYVVCFHNRVQKNIAVPCALILGVVLAMILDKFFMIVLGHGDILYENKEGDKLL